MQKSTATLHFDRGFCDQCRQVNTHSLVAARRIQCGIDSVVARAAVLRYHCAPGGARCTDYCSLLFWRKRFRLALAQISSDRDLLAEINRIKAVDNHTHVEKVVGPGEKDDDYDALPCYLLPPSPDPAMTRPDNPLFLEAWQNLYGYGHSDLSAEHLRELLGGKGHIESEQGDHYPAWILDKLGIEYMLANRIAMGRGLSRLAFCGCPTTMLCYFHSIINR